MLLRRIKKLLDYIFCISWYIYIYILNNLNLILNFDVQSAWEIFAKYQITITSHEQSIPISKHIDMWICLLFIYCFLIFHRAKLFKGNKVNGGYDIKIEQVSSLSMFICVALVHLTDWLTDCWLDSPIHSLVSGWVCWHQCCGIC